MFLYINRMKNKFKNALICLIAPLTIDLTRNFCEQPLCGLPAYPESSVECMNNYTASSENPL
jgi:hypothetical protein